MPGDNGGVHIQGDTEQGADSVEEPARHRLVPLMAQHVEASEQAHDGFVSGYARPAEQPGQGAVQTSDFEVGKAARTTPDGYQQCSMS